MLNSIRTKLTLWYVGVLAVVVIALSVFAFLVLVNTLNQDTDARLVEMARNFGITYTVELAEETDPTASEHALAETVSEMRFRDYQFLVISRDARVIASTAEFSIENPNWKDAEGFKDIKASNETIRLYQSPITAGDKDYRVYIFYSLKRAKRVNKANCVYLHTRRSANTCFGGVRRLFSCPEKPGADG